MQWDNKSISNGHIIIFDFTMAGDSERKSKNVSLISQEPEVGDNIPVNMDSLFREVIYLYFFQQRFLYLHMSVL